MKVLLFSGGIDSSALAYWQQPDILLTVDYGQKAARGEISAATSIAAMLHLKHEILEVNLLPLGQGLMADKASSSLSRSAEWWPYRNQMLLTLAGMKFAGENLEEIIIGAVSTDVHADGKEPFLRSISQTMEAQEGGVRVSAPAKDMDAFQLIERSRFPADLLGLTFSCHTHHYSCGLCPGCKKHSAILRHFG